MAKFLFRFGFCTPEQWKGNTTHGWDDESSEALFVEAESIEAALSWGCEVAESFSRRLFQSGGWGQEIPSWRESGFAYWIERDPETEFSQDLLARLPVVQDGVMPNFLDWNSCCG